MRAVFPAVRWATVVVAAIWMSATDRVRADTPSPPVPSLAAPEVALTLAQVSRGNRTITLLVTALEGDRVVAVDLGEMSGSQDEDAFAVLAAMDRDALVALARAPGERAREVRLGDLLPAGGRATRHVAAGANFPDHAAEVERARVFQFPKFGAATDAGAGVTATPGILLDHEVEICARFDRNIRTVADFDAAAKGFFLCGDFTDRAMLTRLVDADDPASGIGFSDAKSRADFFPAGPFLVVPSDWHAFVATERIALTVDGVPRQNAAGGEMILDFRRIVEKTLAEGSTPRWRYRGAPVPLIEGGVLPRGAVVMSGTPAGVIFRPPGTADIALGIAHYIFTGRFLFGDSPRAHVIERFIAGRTRDRIFLQPGQTVEHWSSRMGAMRIAVR